MMIKSIRVLMLLCISNIALAQNKQISGVVFDAESQSPLSGVLILQKNTQNGTYTNQEGYFTLMLSDKAKDLEVKLLGYESQLIPINNQSEFKVVLKSSTKNLNDVVITALGLERDQKDVGYALQKLDGKEISQIKSPNFLDNLTGKVAGVTIQQGATGVGSTSKIVIRSEASFANNNPLFVVAVANYSSVFPLGPSQMTVPPLGRRRGQPSRAKPTRASRAEPSRASQAEPIRTFAHLGY